jgi:hypothetical protein
MNFDLDKSIGLLSCTPSVLRQLLADLPDEWTMSNEGGETWSAFDVLGHLIHGENTDWIPRAKIILSDADERVFESFDRFAQFRESEGKSLGEMLDAFEDLRGKNVTELQAMGLGPEELVRTGIHPELGEVTLSQLIATWVVHDLDHIAQISRVMARQYESEVGPWREYLRILS